MFDSYVTISGQVFVRYVREGGEPELMTRQEVESRHRHVGDAAEVLRDWPAQRERS